MSLSQMKSSNQTLMLGILMGLVAWVLDALISWHFFPGKSFYEMLFAYDPERTLFVRSTVVLLFFLFGLMTGRLISESEKTQKQMKQHLQLLDGLRRFHVEIVKKEDSEELIQGALTIIEDSFELEDLSFIRLEGEDPVLSTTFGHNNRFSDEVRAELEAKIPEFKKTGRVYWLDAVERGEPFLAPVRLGERLFGVLYGISIPESAIRETYRFQHFCTVCDDLGHALARLHDLHKLNDNAGKLQSLYANAPVGIFTSTVSGKLLFINPTLSMWLEAENPEELLDSHLPVTRFYSNPERREDFVRALKKEGFVADFEVDLTGKHGGKKNLLFAARIVEASDEQDSRIEGFAMDITQSKTAEREKRILQKQLGETQHFKSISVLAGGVAHEFNNILQGMMGSAYLAQMKYPKGKDEIWQYLQDIQNSGKRAAKLCDQMLSYAGKKAMLLKLEHPDACLEDVLKILTVNLSSGIKLEKIFSAPNARARLDLPSFSEMINQLVTNAQESYPEDAEGIVSISTSVQYCNSKDFSPYKLFRPIADDEYWVLKIKDYGSGISEENLPHIFEPFYTTKFQGRGLGLPSVAGLIEKFDGTLGVRTQEHHGTEVVLWIPLAQTVLVEEPVAKDSGEEEDLSGSGRIWVVDDEPLICMTIQRLLSPSGFEVMTANDGVEVLEKLKEPSSEDPRCLILDITMPRMGGLETLENVRKFMPDLPVLIMSGYDESDSLEAFKEFNVAGFIHKPFRMATLQSRLKEILT